MYKCTYVYAHACIYTYTYLFLGFPSSASGKESKVKMLVTQWCPTLCESMDRGAWWATVHGVFLGQNTGKNTGVGCYFLLQGNLPNPQIKHGSQPACQGRRHKKCWLRKIPWRRKWQPTPVFLPGECHGERSLEGYGPQCCKESDTTEVT